MGDEDRPGEQDMTRSGRVTDEDAEGHAARVRPVTDEPETQEDAEGHAMRGKPIADDADAEGHVVRGKPVTDGDTEGHALKPRG